MNAIKQMIDPWKVEITFPNRDQAAEFKKRLDKVIETGGRPLYNALLASSMKHISNVAIVKEGGNDVVAS